MHRLWLVLVGIFGFISLSFAVNSTAELESIFQQMQSIQADFTQKLTGNQKIIQTSVGQVQIQKPNQFRWQINSPNPQLIVTDGRKLWIYDKDLAQVTVKSTQKNLDQTPMALLSGSPVLAKSYAIENHRHWFILTPKTKDSEYEWIKLYFQDKKITAMLLKDKLGQISHFEFSNIKINTPIDQKLFRFKPIKGVDVIEE